MGGLQQRPGIDTSPPTYNLDPLDDQLVFLKALGDFQRGEALFILGRALGYGEPPKQNVMELRDARMLSWYRDCLLYYD